MRRNGTAAGLVAAACAATRASRSRWSRPTRCSTAPGPTACGYAPGRRAPRDQPLRREQAPRGAARSSGSPREHGTAALAILRTSWLHGPPGNDFPAKIAARRPARQGGRRAAQGRRGRGRAAHLHPRRRRRGRGADRRGRASPPAAPAPAIHHLVNAGHRVARRLGPRGRPGQARHRRRGRRRARPAPGPAPPPRPPGPCSSRRRSRRASRCATGARRSPTRSRRWCVRSPRADRHPTAPPPPPSAPGPGGRG